MENIDLSYEPYAGGYMIADYSDENNARFCGTDLIWKSQPIISNPFGSLASAEQAASEHFNGK